MVEISGLQKYLCSNSMSVSKLLVCGEGASYIIMLKFFTHKDLINVLPS